ncbi:MAG: hypothetical protein PHW01_03215 [Patescibacteria group bacterium]|nr:hypothetical protein [Patescibacteria group bacterium]
MAKPTTYATPICLGLTALLIIGAIIGVWKMSPLIIILFLLPAVAYEVYRTEGRSTKLASWVMLLILLAEIIAVSFKINFNLAKFFGEEGGYVGGYYVPFGDLRVIFPAIVAVLSIILFVRTYGVYTKWLAVLIFIGAFVIIYVLDPAVLKMLLIDNIRKVF